MKTHAYLLGLCSFCFICSYCVSLQAASLEQADEFFYATLFDKAIPLYENLLSTLPPGDTQDQVRLRLAESYYAQKNDQGVIALMQEKLQEKEGPAPAFYVLGLAYKRKGSQEQAKAAFERFLQYPESQTLSQASQAHFEIGMIYRQNQAWEKAEEHFRAIHADNPLYAQALLQLAYIALAQKQFTRVQPLLASLENTLSATNPLLCEVSFLKGQTFYHLHDYAKAVVAFENALSQQQSEKAPWYSDALYMLGSCHVMEGKFREGEAILKKLINTQPSEQVFLALGQLYLTKGKQLKDQSAFLGAANFFKESYNRLKETNPSLALLALKYQAEAYGQLKTREGYQQAWASLDLLTRTHTDAVKELQDPAEIYYLKGLAASHLAQWDDGDPYTLGTIEALETAKREYPSSPFADKILVLLGTAYYYKKQYHLAEQTFEQVAQHPQSPEAAEALFWAAKSADAQNLGNEKAKSYRKQVYEKYPLSSYAAEAYFTYYPYREYLQGDRAAIKHLQGMKEKFAKTPYMINAWYLLGMDYKRDRKTAEGRWIRKKNMNDAIEALQEAESTFDALYAEGLITGEDLNYFLRIRYRAILERALANLSIADESQGAKRQIFLEYAQEVLQSMTDDFNEPQHVFTRHLTTQQAYSPFLEESSYWLAQAYSKGQQDAEAEKILSGMLQKYKSAKITRGYYLSRVLYELGMISMRRKDPNQALIYFAQAEDAAKGKLLNTDQRIDLWIQESLCHKELNDTDKAMLILSKAINDDAISSLRVKAQYLRAEIYAQQGRHELARKQLEATSKKGGEWASKAKQKLDQEYGHK